MIRRPAHLNALKRLVSHHPVVALVGARQVGETTLARELAWSRKGLTHFFDLESTADLARLADPLLALSPLRGLVVLDEVQRRPDLFPTLRVLSDRPHRPARFLVLGSASPGLLRQSSETLAGRIAYYELPGFSLSELTESKADILWLRGGFPRSFTARSHKQSYEWRGEFIRTFLERDVPQLGITIPSPTLDRFWSMLAHYHAQVWNGSELARAFGVSHHTVRRYLDGAEIDLVVRQGTKLRGFEIKRTTAPAFTRSMRSALRDLNLSRIDLIHAGTESFALDKQVHAVAAQRLLRDIP